MPTDRRALAATLAPDVRAKPPADEWSPPIAWLLGPELLGSLKSFLLYAAYKGELDSHDWMEARPIAYDAPGDGGAFWFDYVSDIGDGQRAMYTTACVVQDDLHVEGGLDELGARRAGAAALPAQGPAPAGWSTLPRGRVLVVGGDTAYPLADQTNLEAHVREPFTWAYRDLVAAGRLVDDAGAPRAPCDLVGVPGNHDYYDQLTGFNRMFRATVVGDGAIRGKRPPLTLLGLTRVQQASYFALHLPWGWRLWGLDPGDGDLDFRQRAFFRDQGTPSRLVVAYPSPPVAFGRVIVERPLARTLAELGLAAPYLADAPRLLDGRAPDATWPRELAPGQCRLDLSGDMHHYARYGDDGGPYAAVVSGAGGAFHHPSSTDFGEVATRAVYPSPPRSRRAIADALFHPRTIFNGGVVNVAAFALALVVCAGSIRRDTRVVTDWLLAALGVDGERPWFSSARPRAWHPVPWSSLRGAAIFGGSVVLAGGLVLLALGYARWVTRTVRKPPAQWPRAFRVLRALPFDRVLEERGFLPSWLLVIAAAALPALAGQLVALPPAAALLFQLLFLSVVVVLGLALVVFALRAGGEFARPGERVRFGLFGAAHAVMHLTLPLLIVRLGLADPVALLVALGVAIALGAASRELFARRGRGARGPLLALWLGHWVAIVAILDGLGGRVAIVPASDLGWVAFLALAGAVGSIVGCMEYGWYLAMCCAWNGHNNEAGAAARVERFRELVRFRVEPDRLTGFVIAVDEPGTELGALRPRVVDVFTITTGPRAAAAGPVVSSPPARSEP